MCNSTDRRGGENMRAYKEHISKNSKFHKENKTIKTNGWWEVVIGLLSDCPCFKWESLTQCVNCGPMGLQRKRGLEKWSPGASAQTHSNEE